MKKELIGIFVCIILVGSVLPVTGNVIVDKIPLSLDNGNTLYVGGDGEGNYTYIQDAINDSVDGDTVFVYSGTYFGNLVVDKSIMLMGEDRDTTVIHGQYVYNTFTAVVQIKDGLVSIQGFTIKAFYDWSPGNYYGIQILSNNNSIKNNIIKKAMCGIFLGKDINWGSDDNIIMGNIIEENDMAGISSYGHSSNNIFSYNTIKSNHYDGICLHYWDGKNNSITYNNIHSNGQIGIRISHWDSNIIKYNNIHSNKMFGIELYESDSNVIQYNNIINNNGVGLYSENSYQNDISKNNIFDNKLQIRLYGYLRDLIKGNLLMSNNINANYWGQKRIFPKLILATYTVFVYIPIFTVLLFDSNPASEPYDIDNVKILEEEHAEKPYR